MKILYGVQATGQGHISRARAMAHALTQHDVDVTWLFSGRASDKLFDMEPFGAFEHRRGLTFVTDAGRLRHRRTVWANNVPGFFKDVSQIDLSRYDLVVTDYEPVTAWASRRQGHACIGLGHQYAFGANTPVAGANVLQRTVMQRFAPVQRPVGLHWAAFNDNVLPPILDLPNIDGIDQGDHVLVYLPFEDQDAVSDWLRQFSKTRFYQYASGIADAEQGNVRRRTANIAGFKADLARSRGVICNSGFELISECLQWRKPVLTRPLKGQMEQLSNAAALQQLGYASVMHTLDPGVTRQWLEAPRTPPALVFHDVAKRLARWLAEGAQTPVATLSTELWSQSGGERTGD